VCFLLGRVAVALNGGVLGAPPFWAGQGIRVRAKQSPDLKQPKIIHENYQAKHREAGSGLRTRLLPAVIHCKRPRHRRTSTFGSILEFRVILAQYEY